MILCELAEHLERVMTVIEEFQATHRDKLRKLPRDDDDHHDDGPATRPSTSASPATSPNSTSTSQGSTSGTATTQSGPVTEVSNLSDFYKLASELVQNQKQEWVSLGDVYLLAQARGVGSEFIGQVSLIIDDTGDAYADADDNDDPESA